MPKDNSDEAKSKVPPSIKLAECIVCREQIKAGARKCIHCDSYQDWREYFNFSSSMLAWLVALVSVISLSLPVIKNALQKDNSKVVLAFQGIEEGYISLIASNLGTRPGSVGSAELIFDNGDGETQTFSLLVHESTSGAALIKEGFSGRIQLTLKNFGFRTTQENLLNLQAIKCYIVVEVIQFDGRRENFKLDAPWHLAKEFLIFHFNQPHGKINSQRKFLTNCNSLAISQSMS